MFVSPLTNVPTSSDIKIWCITRITSFLNNDDMKHVLYSWEGNHGPGRSSGRVYEKLHLPSRQKTSTGPYGPRWTTGLLYMVSWWTRWPDLSTTSTRLQSNWPLERNYTQAGPTWVGCWHCSHSMQQGLCNRTVSVCLSVPSIDRCSRMWRVCCWCTAANASSVTFTAAVERLNTDLLHWVQSGIVVGLWLTDASAYWPISI